MSRDFPIIHDRRMPSTLEYPSVIPWDLISKHESQAQYNHGQTLERLAKRGGLSLAEAYYVLRDERFNRIVTVQDEHAARYIDKRIELHELAKDIKEKMGG